MNSKIILTAKELLSGSSSDFDPLNIDTSEIRELSAAIPASGEIDLTQAEILTTKFLRAADMCSELLAIATCHLAKLESVKKKAYSDAALIKATKAGIKTDKSRCLFAEGDNEYINACNKHAEAQAFVKWISSKYENFIRSHYMCKKMLDRGYQHERASEWERDGVEQDLEELAPQKKEKDKDFDW